MKALNEQQREQLAKAIYGAVNSPPWEDNAFQGNWRMMADAVYAFLAPICYGEALGQPTEAENAKFRGYGPLTAISDILADRLYSLTAPAVDPRVEAISRFMQQGVTHWTSTASPEQIVAALDRLKEEGADGK